MCNSFSLVSANRLRIQIRTQEKAVFQEFARVADENSANQSFNQIQLPKVREILRAARDIDDPSSCTEALLSYLIEKGRFSCAKYLIEKGAAYKGQAFLQAAVKSGDVKMLKYLLQKGVPPDEKDQYNITALSDTITGVYSSSLIGDHGWISTAFDKYELIKALIVAGANFNAAKTTYSGTKPTPFGELLATEYSADAVQLMLDRGADPTCLCSFSGDSPFASATMGYQTRWGSSGYALVERLLKMGANPNSIYSDRSGGTFGWAMTDGDVKLLKLLQKYGGDLRGYQAQDNLLTVAQLKILELKKNLQSPDYSPYRVQLRILKQIKQIEMNATYVKSQIN